MTRQSKDFLAAEIEGFANDELVGLPLEDGDDPLEVESQFEGVSYVFRFSRGDMYYDEDPSYTAYVEVDYIVNGTRFEGLGDLHIVYT